MPVYLVEANDPLPKYGSVTLRAAEVLVGGSDGALTFTLWEGEIADPVEDNRYIGIYRIPGSAFSHGVIPVGAEVVCDYVINEAGSLQLGVAVPCLGLRLEKQNYYSRYEGQSDLEDSSSLLAVTNDMLERTAQLQQYIFDEDLAAVRRELLKIRHTLSHTIDPESIAQAESSLLDCLRRTALLSQKYSNLIRTRKLQKVLDRFTETEGSATKSEVMSFRNLAEAARFSIDMGSSDFESQIREMRSITARILWRSDSYVLDAFRTYSKMPDDFPDRAIFDRLCAAGRTCLENGDKEQLRSITLELNSRVIRKTDRYPDELFDEVSVYKG